LAKFRIFVFKFENIQIQVHQFMLELTLEFHHEYLLILDIWPRSGTEKLFITNVLKTDY